MYHTIGRMICVCYPAIETLTRILETMYEIQMQIVRYTHSGHSHQEASPSASYLRRGSVCMCDTEPGKDFRLRPILGETIDGVQFSNCQDMKSYYRISLMHNAGEKGPWRWVEGDQIPNAEENTAHAGVLRVGFHLAMGANQQLPESTIPGC